MDVVGAKVAVFKVVGVFPEMGVVDVTTGIVTDGGANVGGEGVEILKKFFSSLFL